MKYKTTVIKELMNRDLPIEEKLRKVAIFADSSVEALRIINIIKDKSVEENFVGQLKDWTINISNNSVNRTIHGKIYNDSMNRVKDGGFIEIGQIMNIDFVNWTITTKDGNYKLIRD